MLLHRLLYRSAGRPPVRRSIALLFLLGCGSADQADPSSDPEAPATQTRLVVRPQGDAAERTEQEQRVLAIESDRGEPARGLDEDEWDQVLGYYCGECHLGHPEQCGMSYIDDLDKLIDTGKVVPGDSAASRLVQRMLRAEMPPIGSGSPAVPEGTVELIVEFIDNLPAE